MHNQNLELLKEYNETVVNESSLSRVIQHVNNPNSKFAVISAFLDDNDNESNHKSLKQDIRAMGYGFIELSSGYSYLSNDSRVFAEEKSFMIPEISKEDAIKLAKKYGQQSILWKDSDEFVLIATRNDGTVTDGEVLMSFASKDDKPITFDKELIQQAFSALIKGSNNQAKVKFSFKELKEKRIMGSSYAYYYASKGFDKEYITIIGE